LDDGTVYAGTARKGIFMRRTGEDWTRIPSTLFDETLVNALIEYEGQLWAGTSDRGIYFSFDGGISWDETSTGLKSMITYAFLASQGGSLYVATAKGVYRRSDEVWVELTGGVEGADARSIAANVDGDLFVGAFNVGVLRSLDAGSSWALVDTVGAVRSVAVGQTGEIFVGMFGGDVVQRSEDNGDTWIAASNGLETSGVWAVLVDNQGVLYAGARTSGIFYSEDGGRSWTAADAPSTPVRSLSLATSGRVWAATNAGAALTSDNGRTWTVEGIPHSRTRAVIVEGDRVMAGSDLGGIYISDAAQTSWSSTKVFGGAVFAIERGPDGAFFASTTGRLYTSVDRGTSWKSIWKTFLFIFSIAVDSRGVVFAGTEDGIYRRSVSPDTAWTRVAIPGIRVESLAIDPDDNVFAGTVSNSMFRSEDGGETWDRIGPQFAVDGECICALEVFNDGRLAAAPLREGGVWLSPDKGDTWQATQGAAETHVLDLSFDPYHRLVAASENGWILMLDGESDSWTAHGPRLEESSVLSLAVDSMGTAFVGTIDRGVYKMKDALPPPVSTAIDRDRLPDASALALPVSVYPNPFATSVTISYELSLPSDVALAVFDVLGRRVTLLISEHQDSGRHSVAWTGQPDGARLADGLYILQLRVGETTETRSITLAR